MALVNENFLELPQDNVFADIRREVEKFKVIHPSYRLIDLSVNDVTHSLGAHVAESMRQAVDEMVQVETFHGYGPEQGYGFLREAIIKHDFNPRGIHLTPEEIFVNDGIKSEIGNIGEILGNDNAIGVADPVYPIYVESNVVSGRAGVFRGGHWSNVNYL
ncbi:MAG: aminotransferase class I/II-fold pyridoxal phosphate-dependent enzyme, partial [Oscillospiraceae bacterium]|nr:aminotransferase class I/II-fold pyridoxal phosphate-dependent enzyme [Oscillospiraceae bacterium]